MDKAVANGDGRSPVVYTISTFCLYDGGIKDFL